MGGILLFRYRVLPAKNHKIDVEKEKNDQNLSFCIAQFMDEALRHPLIDIFPKTCEPKFKFCEKPSNSTENY